MNTEVRRARKKPVEIDFMVWPGGAANATPVINWILNSGGTAVWTEEYVHPSPAAYVVPEHIAIRTLQGDMKAAPGDVIIRGVAGEFYSCKPEIFRETYDIITTDEEPMDTKLMPRERLATIIADAATEAAANVTGIFRNERMTWTQQGVHAAAWNAVMHDEQVENALRMAAVDAARGA